MRHFNRSTRKADVRPALGETYELVFYLLMWVLMMLVLGKPALVWLTGEEWSALVEASRSNLASLYVPVLGLITLYAAWATSELRRTQRHLWDSATLLDQFGHASCAAHACALWDGLDLPVHENSLREVSERLEQRLQGYSRKERKLLLTTARMAEEYRCHALAEEPDLAAHAALRVRILSELLQR